MKIVRTPDQRFEKLPDFSFAPNYTEVDDGEGGTLRIHHLDEGPTDGELILCLHGNPSWAFLYRKMIPVFVAAGYRVIAPDLVGFGRSDKPALPSDHSYSRHVSWMTRWLEGLDLRDINLFCQDWGGLIGLRVVAALPDRFARVVASNTSLPTSGGVPIEKAKSLRARYDAVPVVPTKELVQRFVSNEGAPGFWYWRKYCESSPEFRVRNVMAVAFGGAGVSPEVLAAYEAPFPDEAFVAAPRVFASMAPIFPDDPEVEANARAWKVLESFERPFRTSFSNDDFVGRPGDAEAFQTRVPGADGVDHLTIRGGGHFLQETKGPEVATAMVDFIRSSSV
ncbi:MAG: haloalkane dehalogenase [Myxococcota bacterium]